MAGACLGIKIEEIESNNSTGLERDKKKIEAFLEENMAESDSPSLGRTCTYTPEEMIFAAGFQPARIAEPASPIKKADAYFHRNLCPYVKSCLDFGFKIKILD